MQIGERDIPIRKERIDVRGINSYVFVGGGNEGTQVLISVLGDDIQGVIETGEEVYTIQTVGKQQYALITVDYSKLREACDDLHEDNYRSFFDDTRSHDYVSNIENIVDDPASPVFNATSENDCKIRVLVLYTQNAQSSVSNMKNTILTAVALTNQSFINSQVNYQIELAYAGQTNYTESGFYTDLTRFRNSSDGYMDEVHALRNKYSADVCVLLIDDCDYCGLATGIGVSESNAFCAVSTCSNCATSNYSFGHEIGHLLGCRHDPSADSGTTPFSYGHGYVNPSETWRTIMAYGTCPRLQYWSNPNVTHGGEPMGTGSTNDNTRVWNERTSTVMAFRQPDNNVTFTSSDIPNTQYADVIAKQNITTSGTVTVNNGNSLTMRAGNSILLQPGFSVQVGAEFSAKAYTINDCGDCASAAQAVIVQNASEEYENHTDAQIGSRLNFSYTVFPDSSAGILNITCSVDMEMPLSISFVNFMGHELKVIRPGKKLKAGDYQFQIPIAEYSAGTYFLTISSGEQTETEKIIIKS